MIRSTVPARPATAPRFGLLASVDSIIRNEFRWEGGIAYEPEGCVEGTTLGICDPAAMAAPTKPGEVVWYPFQLTIQEECTTSSGEPDNRRARVRRLLEMDTERQLGAELWDGDVAQVEDIPGTAEPYPNTWLANVGTVDILTESGPVALTHGLACLEEYLAQNNGGQQGMIHATAQTVTHWQTLDLLRRDNDKIVTVKDTVVVISPGYSGNSIDGTIGTDNIWAYATDMVRVFLGSIQTFTNEEEVDRDRNNIVVTAWRPGLAEWERCRHGGARLSLTRCGVGGS